MVISAYFCGATEIRTRETLLTFTRFPDFSLYNPKDVINI